MLNARTNHSLVFCGDSFFAIGGANLIKGTINDVERLNLSPNSTLDTKWYTSPNMVAARKDMLALTDGKQKIFVAGGCPKSSYEAKIEIFDILMD